MEGSSFVQNLSKQGAAAPREGRHTFPNSIRSISTALSLTARKIQSSLPKNPPNSVHKLEASAWPSRCPSPPPPIYSSRRRQLQNISNSMSHKSPPPLRLLPGLV